MTRELIGALAGALVAGSAVPYLYALARGRITVTPVSWILWSFNGLMLLLVYLSVGSRESIWPVIFAFVNPTLVVIVSYLREHKNEREHTKLLMRTFWRDRSFLERVCLVLGPIAVIGNAFAQTKEQSSWAMAVAIGADAFATIPTIVFLWRNPMEDKPFAWTVMGCGYFLALFSVEGSVWGAYILPAYMAITGVAIVVPLVARRLKDHTPLPEWVV